MARRSLLILVSSILIASQLPPSAGYDNNVGRMVRGHMGTLYNLRNKLSGSASPTVATVTSAPPASQVRKESRGYAFHYSPSEVTNPIYPASNTYSSQQQSFNSRMGKLDDEPLPPSKIKSSVKNWSKLAKYNNKISKEKDNAVNSFNLHQNSEQESSATIPSTVEEQTSTTSSSPTTIFPPMSPIQSLGQGLNTAMTNLLTQKLMSMLDQDVPQGLFTPLKHLVASGNKMIEFWDKRAIARDGKNAGIVEVLGYGLDQLKKFRDGQAIRPSDPVANLTSPSKTLIQGMLTVKKLTNRVLGYDTSNEIAESRGGYGHDSYGHGGGYGQYVSYGGGGGMYGGLDPFSLLAALAFGAFLLQLLLTLLNTSARSLNVVDLNTPLMMSDFHLPNFMTSADKLFGTPTVRSKRDVGYGDSDEGGQFFDSAVDKLHGLYRTYKEISEKPTCARLYLCRVALDDAFSDESSILSPLYMYGLGHLAKDKSATQFVQEIKTRVTNGESVDCDKLVKGCVQKDKRKSKL